MTDERKEFGKKLIELRERKGLRQADVADIINLIKLLISIEGLNICNYGNKYGYNS